MCARKVCAEDEDDQRRPLDFEAWCSEREQSCPQFQYWATVLALELSTLIFVRSLREADFNMYLDALTELTAWFCALDHTNYARWIPVHLRDMAELANTHPDICREFNAGHFTVQKTSRVFSPSTRAEQCLHQGRWWSSWPHGQPKCFEEVDGCWARGSQSGWRI